MIDSQGIYSIANNLIQSYGTQNPMEIASSSGIYVASVDYFKHLLGLYICRMDLRSIFLNNRMDPYLTRIVAAHELGHDLLHRDIAVIDGLQDFDLFRINNAIEYEANAFAAHLLIDTDECIEYARNGYDVVTIAKCMETEINLMLIKLQELKRLGYDLPLPMTATGDFLKKIEV
ncbi:MAG: ImmA/IrrE family metallo-endopeptidase [Alphaproteobacteria bacterium]|nr:ImmA/IrrE family metallo-endopeptidase [Clostridia bacterium]MBQ7673548.1 ImmA/IrrE family metallo-endopeptidase [Alphaproteobacteria bacterium]